MTDTVEVVARAIFHAEMANEPRGKWGWAVVAECDQDSYRRMAQAAIDVIGLPSPTAEYGLHDVTQSGTADVDMWWTDDPSEGFVARDAALDALKNTDEFPHHVLVRRYVTSWETTE